MLEYIYMRICREEDRIIIENPDNFDIVDILECGQVFRFIKHGEKDYTVFSLDKKARVYTVDDKIIINFPKGDCEYFYNYFDLGTDYSLIIKMIGQISKGNAAESRFITDAVEFGRGMRILRQDKVETIISFIISANNNIKRIQGIIDRLCTAAGERKDGYYAFPTASALAKFPESFYNEIGAGYRSNYLYETVQALNSGFDLSKVDTADTALAEKMLYTLKGVGPKVANCILLFGFYKTDTFPVDTWIAKAFGRFYGQGGAINRKQMQETLISKYGSLAGYIQQYVFYAARENGVP